jgi:hypothetical protein
MISILRYLSNDKRYRYNITSPSWSYDKIDLGTYQLTFSEIIKLKTRRQTFDCNPKLLFNFILSIV